MYATVVCTPPQATKPACFHVHCRKSNTIPIKTYFEIGFGQVQNWFLTGNVLHFLSCCLFLSCSLFNRPSYTSGSFQSCVAEWFRVIQWISVHPAVHIKQVNYKIWKNSGCGTKFCHLPTRTTRPLRTFVIVVESKQLSFGIVIDYGTNHWHEQLFPIKGDERGKTKIIWFKYHFFPNLPSLVHGKEATTFLCVSNWSQYIVQCVMVQLAFEWFVFGPSSLSFRNRNMRHIAQNLYKTHIYQVRHQVQLESITFLASFLFITCRGKFPIVMERGFALCEPLFDSQVPSKYKMIGNKHAPWPKIQVKYRFCMVKFCYLAHCRHVFCLLPPFSCVKLIIYSLAICIVLWLRTTHEFVFC